MSRYFALKWATSSSTDGKLDNEGEERGRSSVNEATLQRGMEGTHSWGSSSPSSVCVDEKGELGLSSWALLFIREVYAGVVRSWLLGGRDGTRNAAVEGERIQSPPFSALSLSSNVGQVYPPPHGPRRCSWYVCSLYYVGERQATTRS